MTIFKVLGNPQNANEPKCKAANEAQQTAPKVLMTGTEEVRASKKYKRKYYKKPKLDKSLVQTL